MRNHPQNCTPGPEQPNWLAQSDPRFPDLKNRFKIRWRDALVALLGPAERLHQMRSLRSSMFYKAIDEIDCRKPCERTTKGSI